VLKTESDLHDATLLDDAGDVVPLQSLGADEWIFVAKNIPPLSSKVYRVVYGKRKKTLPATELTIHENEITNGQLSVHVDPHAGAISQLVSNQSGKNFAAGTGLNAFVYSGRNASDPVVNATVEKIIPVRSGPVAS